MGMYQALQRSQPPAPTPTPRRKAILPKGDLVQPTSGQGWDRHGREPDSEAFFAAAQRAIHQIRGQR
jgi:hypothetical protein